MKLIITIDNIREFRPLARTIDPARIQPYIQEAQQIDLKQLLGPALYLDFYTKYDDSSQGATYTAYQELLKGKTYTYGGKSIEHPGLIGYLVYSALARFMPNNQVNATSFGVVMKDWEGSTAVDANMMRQVVTELRSNALAFKADIEKFLSSNPTNYPLYAPSDGSFNNGPMFFDPDNDQMYHRSGRTLDSL
jgi:hypothetical protein